ncbi:Phosphatidate phosphatase [uncultured virus]|nr:Phosphatidate phosphatase [uncultured virus]
MCCCNGRWTRSVARVRAPVTENNANGSYAAYWNGVARALVAKYSLSPPIASRLYAILSETQKRAIASFVYANANDLLGELELSRASRYVLTALFPQEAETLLQNPIGRAAIGEGAARSTGVLAAQQVLAERADDGWNRVWSGTLPVGPGLWVSAPGRQPLLPLWGEVRCWDVADPSSLVPPPFPAFGSADFSQQVAEVRSISDHRSEAETALARYWADGPGTATPPGHWNEIACWHLTRAGWSDRRIAAALALLNRAMCDAGIVCWRAKYQYCVARASQLDPGITLAVGLPNFPSYVSVSRQHHHSNRAHSCSSRDILRFRTPQRRCWRTCCRSKRRRSLRWRRPPAFHECTAAFTFGTTTTLAR